VKDAGPTLLLVENDERILELLAWFLERRGFRVRAAASFESARAVLAEEQPDLLVSDLCVGDADARAELMHLDRMGVLPPTVVASGYLDDSLSAALLRHPKVLATLSKPFRFEDLELLIRRCLDGLAAPQGCAPFHPEG
jgi:DNA-binding NtrC family response regulator